MKIAICDDNEDLLKNMHFILQNIFKQYTSYFEIFSFSSGNLLLKSHKESNFDVIFLDIDMPEINGFDVAKNIRMGYSGCRIIFITSHSELVKFSKHASQRLESRNISLSEEQNARLEDGVEQAHAKGIKDSLVLVDSLAFIVNVPSKTVVTAMDQTETQSNIFTNIDGAVIM